MSHTKLTLFQKKKVLTAYQIFYKEYRNSILEEEPGLGEFPSHNQMIDRPAEELCCSSVFSTVLFMFVFVTITQNASVMLLLLLVQISVI